MGKLNAKNSGSIEFQNSASVATTSHEARPFNRQKFVSIVSQQYFGQPTRPCPAGCQANTLLIQRCPGNVEKVTTHRSGQVRPVRQRRARFRAQAQKMKICTQLLFTCGKNLQTNQDVSSIGCCPMPHLSNIQDSHIGSTHQALNPRCFVDGPIGRNARYCLLGAKFTAHRNPCKSFPTCKASISYLGRYLDATGAGDPELWRRLAAAKRLPKNWREFGGILPCTPNKGSISSKFVSCQSCRNACTQCG